MFLTGSPSRYISVNKKQPYLIQPALDSKHAGFPLEKDELKNIGKPEILERSF